MLAQQGCFIKMTTFTWSTLSVLPSVSLCIYLVFTEQIPGYVRIQILHLLDNDYIIFLLKFQIFTHENYEDKQHIS